MLPETRLRQSRPFWIDGFASVTQHVVSGLSIEHDIEGSGDSEVVPSAVRRAR
jgi:hypothetical protein